MSWSLRVGTCRGRGWLWALALSGCCVPVLGQSIQQQINNWFALPAGSRPAEIDITDGTYVVPTGNAINLSGKSNATINLTNVRIVMGSAASGASTKNWVHAIKLTDCSNITIKANTPATAAQIDYNPLPITQGIIRAIPTNRAYIDVEIDAGYPLPANWSPPANKPDEKLGRVTIHVASGTALKPNTRVRYISQVQALTNGRYRFYLGGGSQADSTAVGDRAACPMVFDDRAIDLSGCSNITFRSIDIESSPGGGVLDVDCDNIVYDDVDIWPGANPPGASVSRMRSVVADGFHVSQALNGPTIRNCNIKAPGDDGMNIFGRVGFIHRTTTGTVNTSNIQLAYLPNAKFEVGDILWLYRGPGNNNPLQRRIGSISPTSAKDADNRPIYNVSLTSLTSPYPAQAITVADNDLVENVSRQSFGCLIEDNTITYAGSRGMVLKIRNATINNNNITTSLSCGMILIVRDPEGGFCKTLQITNNTIERSNQYTSPGDNQAGALAIVCDAEYTNDYSWGRYGHRDITIQDNIFNENVGLNLQIQSGFNIDVISNDFIKPFVVQPSKSSGTGLSPPIPLGTLVWVNNASSVDFTGNTVSQAGSNLNTPHVLQGPGAMNVTGQVNF